MGTYNHGLLQFGEGKFRPAQGSGRLNPHILAIHQDRQGKMWVGTEGGLGCWDGESWRVYSTTNGLSMNAVQAIADDSRGNLWLGTPGAGINCLKDGRFTCFGKTNGLPSDTIGSLLVDADDVVWAGTSGGVARYENQNWTCFAAREGLATSNIGYLIQDGLGYLWIGSNVGLMRIRKEALNEAAAGKPNSIPVRTYDEADGLAT